MRKLLFLSLFLHIIFCAKAQPSGSIDLSFNPTDIGFGFGDGANSIVRTTSIQSDGKIIIGGDFTSYNGISRNHIARLNADGTPDSTFTVGTGANNRVYTTSIQSDGKIIIGGVFTIYNGTVINRIARLNTDGTLDSTFTVGTGANSDVETTSIQSDGKIIIGGGFSSYNGTAINYITRLNTDGTLDSTFTVGTGADNTVFTTSIQSDGKIIIGGWFTFYNGTAINRIARLNTDGTLDSTFTVGTGANWTVSTTSIQPDGKIIIGGGFTTYNGTARNSIARLNADGTLDSTFTVGTGASSTVRTTSLQSDGKIIIGGNFTSYNGTGRNYIARLNADGTLDGTFTVGTGANWYVRTTYIQSDGKIIIGGWFTSYNGTAINRIARLNADGTLDGTFTVGTGANSVVGTTSIQSDGKIIIGGQFTSYNGTTINRIARLNADGTLDGTFNPGTGADNTVFPTSIQSDGKIIIGGWFTSYNGTAINRIARLNADGTLDGTFTVGTGANSYVWTTSIQSDGKIIIGGNFTSYNGTAINRIARLNTDGTLDGTFTVGPGANNVVQTTSIQSDGKIIIGGWFTSYNGTGRNRIARLLNGTPATIQTSAAICSGCSILKIYPNPNTGKFNIVMNITPARPAGGQAENLELKIVNNLGQVLFREELKQFKGIYEKQLDLNKYPVGIYNLQLISKKGVINKQIIILND
ncbi:MAG: T9SS type A sorting domain-containing protein [Cytophagales bacterium]|nr:T9SS type A sorting domain-containing protein [Cytophagales bacterium]